jgi:hypothetical protein
MRELPPFKLDDHHTWLRISNVSLKSLLFLRSYWRNFVLQEMPTQPNCRQSGPDGSLWYENTERHMYAMKWVEVRVVMRIVTGILKKHAGLCDCAVKSIPRKV